MSPPCAGPSFCLPSTYCRARYSQEVGAPHARHAQLGQRGPSLRVAARGSAPRYAALVFRCARQSAESRRQEGLALCFRTSGGRGLRPRTPKALGRFFVFIPKNGEHMQRSG